jgi:hypothetical protein
LEAALRAKVASFLTEHGLADDGMSAETQRRLVALWDSGQFYLEKQELWPGQNRDNTEQYLANVDALYKPAASTVPAYEYWENFFAAQPSARPAHIIYYDGAPRQAILKFLAGNNLIALNDLEDYTVAYDTRVRSVDQLMQSNSLQLKQRAEPLHMPPGTILDLANFSIHEWGNWMYTMKQSARSQ